MKAPVSQSVSSPDRAAHPPLQRGQRAAGVRMGPSCSCATRRRSESGARDGPRPARDGRWCMWNGHSRQARATYRARHTASQRPAPGAPARSSRRAAGAAAADEAPVSASLRRRFASPIRQPAVAATGGDWQAPKTGRRQRLREAPALHLGGRTLDGVSRFAKNELSAFSFSPAARGRR
jgi:hypothetical protein